MIMSKISATTQGVSVSSTQASDVHEYQTETYDQKYVPIDTSSNNIYRKGTDYTVSVIVNQKSIVRGEFRKINNLLKGISKV
jgi:hypothetical protein